LVWELAVRATDHWKGKKGGVVQFVRFVQAGRAGLGSMAGAIPAIVGQIVHFAHEAGALCDRNLATRGRNPALPRSAIMKSESKSSRIVHFVQRNESADGGGIAFLALRANRAFRAGELGV
jgi:hypothetical protein